MAPRSSTHLRNFGIFPTRDPTRKDFIAMLRRAADRAVLGRLVGNPLIHVVNEESQAASNTLGLEKDRPTKETREAHQQFMKIASEVGISAATRIARGPAKKALLQAVAEFDADVLIIGRTSERESVGRLRDLTYAVVRDSPFPVLSV